MKFKINEDKIHEFLEARLPKLLKEDKKMITLEELKRDKEALEEKFRKYEEQEKAEVKEKYELEYPDDFTKIFVMRPNGTYYEYTYDDDSKEYFEQGHVKFTEEEAELEVKRRKLMTRFNQFRNKCNGDWKPDFNVRKTEGLKYYIVRNDNFSTGLAEHSTSSTDVYPKFGYFKNKEDFERAIELFGEEIKELF